MYPYTVPCPHIISPRPQHEKHGHVCGTVYIGCVAGVRPGREHGDHRVGDDVSAALVAALVMQAATGTMIAVGSAVALRHLLEVRRLLDPGPPPVAPEDAPTVML